MEHDTNYLYTSEADGEPKIATNHNTLAENELSGEELSWSNERYDYIEDALGSIKTKEGLKNLFLEYPLNNDCTCQGMILSPGMKPEAWV